ncbi:MAG: D-glycerate dehydrogenase [Nitrospinae bacterium]|nr:D-glycerate dehydrogenase [Nitrospinota bacterium]
MDGRPKVLISRSIPQAALEIVARECQVEVNERDVRLTQEELIERLLEKEGLLCLLTDRVDAAVLAAAPRLRVVANVAVGYDNIDVAEASRRGILVTHTPGVLTETTADLTWALLLAVARRVVEADRYVRSGQWREWGLQLLLGSDVHGKVLGILGFGRIGQAVARRGMGFGMQNLYHSRRRASPEVEAALKARYVDPETLLREADFVSLHLPLTPETTHFLTAREFSWMKPTAYLINTARGPIIREEDLVEALRMGRIAGAGLDVYEREPTLAPGLTDLPNVVLAPHIGSSSVETRTRMAVMAAENLTAALAGRRPPNPVNPEIP